MREINIEIFNDKIVKVSNKGNLGDKYDNNISQINFIFDACDFHKDLIYNYFAIKNESKEDFTLIDISNNKTIVINEEFTKEYVNKNNCLVILSDKEILEYFANDRSNFVSNQFSLSITDNFINKNKFTILETKEAL